MLRYTDIASLGELLLHSFSGIGCMICKYSHICYIIYLIYVNILIIRIFCKNAQNPLVFLEIIIIIAKR